MVNPNFFPFSSDKIMELPDRHLIHELSLSLFLLENPIDHYFWVQTTKVAHIFDIV